MKVGVLTFHFVNNYGGALQAYALQHAIAENLSIECEIINYHNWFIWFTDTIRLFPVTSNLQEICTGLRSMEQRWSRVKRFRLFIKENCKLTRYYGNYLQLEMYPPQCDKYVCGSDQIWNPYLTAGVSPVYFLAFVKDPKNKVAYAPSFGMARISGFFLKKIRRYLASFINISVREASGQTIIQKLTGKSAKQLIDPVFLLDKNVWGSLAVEMHQTEKYILLYIMQRDEEVYKYAKKMKEQLGVKIVEISRYGYKPDFVDESLVDVGPREFLGLFRDATYICTNSYHGLSYSIIFEKDFCLVPCKRFTTRIENLLNLLDIEKTAKSSEQESIIMFYDKEKVREIIAKERQKALSYLNESILEDK